MGCGKSSVGRELSRLLCCRFMDLDEVIENEQGRKIPEIFACDGEAAFRKMEEEALRRIVDEYSSSSGATLVLALGGGTVMTPGCARLVHEYTFCIYLHASVGTLVSHLASEAAGRPMLQSPAASQSAATASEATPTDMTEALRERITGLMALRASTYESVSHLTLATDGRSVPEIAGLILCSDSRIRCLIC